jgi:hypothetical protein
MNIPGGALVYQGSAVEAVPRQFPECFTGLVFFCKISDQNAYVHAESFI